MRVALAGLAFVLMAASAVAQQTNWKVLNGRVLQFLEQGHFAEAILIAEEALRVAEANSASDPEVAQSLTNLAKAYQELGRYAEAEPPFKRSLAIREKEFGLEHPYVAQSLNSLADVFASVRDGRIVYDGVAEAESNSESS